MTFSNSTNGMNVVVTFNDGTIRTFNNVTEIHYNFEGSNQIAFESDIHSHGMNIYTNSIKEFEVEPDNKHHKHFTK